MSTHSTPSLPPKLSKRKRSKVNADEDDEHDHPMVKVEGTAVFPLQGKQSREKRLLGDSEEGGKGDGFEGLDREDKESRRISRMTRNRRK